MSIQLRPDVLLAALCLVFAFAIARAIDRRSVGWYAASALLIGFATMVKLHALALLLPLVVAALWRPPGETELPASLGRARGFVRAHRVAAGSIGGLWLALAVVLNWDRFPFDPSSAQVGVTLSLLAVGLAAVGLAEAAASFSVPPLVRRVASRFHAVLVVSFIGGLLIPVTLDVQDGMRALVYIVRNVSGRGVQAGIEPFSTPLSALDGIVGTPIVFAFLLAVLAGVMGALRREPVPVVWAVAALATGVFAYARPPNVHYFAPAFVFSALALLWLLQRESRSRVPLLAWALVLYLVWPAWDNRFDAAEEQERLVAGVASAKQYTDARLAPGEFALVPSYWPFADARYFELVQISVEHSPEYPYRYLPATAAVRSFEQARQMRPRFSIGLQASDLDSATQVELGDLGRYTIVPRAGLVAEIVAGPGVTEPW
jgi:hypothetical protein